MILRPIAFALLLIVPACAGGDRPAVQEPTDSVAASDPATPVAPVDPWSVSATGAGSIRIGMSLAEVIPLLAEPLDTAAVGAGCTFVTVEGAPAGLMFMVENRRLVRMDVVSGGTRTAAGAGIGDDEATVASIYPGLRVTPHKYTDGRYLIAIPGLPADSLHRIVFETDGTRVTEYRAGIYPPVEYVERCG